MDAVLSSDDPAGGGALTWPDSVILAVLEREHILTKGKLHELRFERLTKETHVYHLRRLINLVGIMEGSHMCVCAAPLGLLFGCVMTPDNIAVPCSVPCCWLPYALQGDLGLHDAYRAGESQGGWSRDQGQVG